MINRRNNDLELLNRIANGGNITPYDTLSDTEIESMHLQHTKECLEVILESAIDDILFLINIIDEMNYDCNATIKIEEKWLREKELLKGSR